MMPLLDDAAIGLGEPGGATPNQFLPRGIRNNNPGNLRQPAGGGFQTFPDMASGIKAADDNLKSYGEKYGISTLAGAISRWAPPTENDTSGYISRVSQTTGIDPFAKIDLSDDSTRKKVLDAMFDHETPGWQAHAPAPKGLLSDADLGLAEPNKTPDEAAAPEHFVKRAARDLAGLGDMVLGIPGGLAATVAGNVEGAYGDIRDLVTGKAGGPGYNAKRVQEQADVEGKVQGWLGTPIARVMHAFGYKDDYRDSDVGKVQSLLQQYISKGGDWIEQHSDGKVTSQQLQVMAGDFMNLAPLGFAKFLRGARGGIPLDELRTGRISPGTAADILSKYADETGNPDGLTLEQMQSKLAESLTTKSDAEISAEAKAYDLMSRGASLKETLAARTRNPLVGKKLDEFMAKRAETIKGPLSRFIPIDEVMDAEPKTDASPGLKTGVQPPDTPTIGGNNPPALPAPSSPDLPPPRPLSGTPNTPAGRALEGPRGQRGAADLRTLVPIALAGAGAAAGYELGGDRHLEGAILGGLGGLAAGLLPGYASKIGGKWGRAAKIGATTAALSAGLTMLDKDHPVEGAVLGMVWGASHLLPRARVPQVGPMSMDELVNARNGAIAVQDRQVYNVANAMRTAVPDPVRRVAVAEAVERGSMAGLNPDETKVARAYQGFTKSFGDAAQNAGVLKDLVQNYVTHVVEREALPLSRVQQVMDALFGGADAAQGGARSTTGFAKARKYASFQELEQALQGSGLKIKTRDIADLVDIYGRSMGRAIENKKLFDALRIAKDGPTGRPFVMPGDKAPGSYEVVQTPQLMGMRVHPDIAPALKFVAEQYRPGYITKGLVSLSLAQKRLSTGLSLFHAQNLINAYIGASGIRAAKLVGDVNEGLKIYREGGAGDAVDDLLKGGLRIERPMEADLHAGAKLGGAVDNLVNGVLGTKFGGFEKGFGAVEKLQRETFDRLTWDYLHTGLKTALGLREYEKGLRAHPDWPKEQVARQVASFVNDTFGGLDWYRVATESQSQLMRNIGLSALSPKGRAGLQLLMFAPDWTLSTFRAMYKALPGSNAMPLTTRLHQKYVMRTALIWATLMNGYNMTSSGHPIWQNKDPTRIEYRDGTSQQIAKHAMEGPQWLLNPRQTAINKLGIPLKEVLEQLTNQEYLNAKGQAPKIDDRLGHLVSSLSPIAVSSGSAPGRSLGETAERTVLSSTGLPIYGSTKAEKEAAKRARARKRGRATTRYGSKPQ